MTPRTRPHPELAPQAAAWLNYAGPVVGLRWRRHLAASPPPAAQARPRLPGPARR